MLPLNMINPVAVLFIIRVEAFVNGKMLIQHLHRFNIRQRQIPVTGLAFRARKAQRLPANQNDFIT